MRLPSDGGHGTGNAGGMEDSAATAVVTSPRQPVRDARDAELERLRRVEANFEKDKAALARRKQPALARSESRDVGHAEGIGDDTDSSEKTADAIYKNIARILQGNSQ